MRGEDGEHRNGTAAIRNNDSCASLRDARGTYLDCSAMTPSSRTIHAMRPAVRRDRPAEDNSQSEGHS